MTPQPPALPPLPQPLRVPPSWPRSSPLAAGFCLLQCSPRSAQYFSSCSPPRVPSSLSSQGSSHPRARLAAVFMERDQKQVMKPLGHPRQGAEEEGHGEKTGCCSGKALSLQIQSEKRNRLLSLNKYRERRCSAAHAPKTSSRGSCVVSAWFVSGSAGGGLAFPPAQHRAPGVPGCGSLAPGPQSLPPLLSFVFFPLSTISRAGTPRRC